MKIYLIDDDVSLVRELGQLLELNDYTVSICEDLDNASELAIAQEPDCVLLDLSLPGKSGHAICRDIRQKSDVPIIIITSSDAEFDEVMSMNLGADDYITKPYSPAVLLARLSSLLRRSSKADSAKITHKGVSLDIASAKVEYNALSEELTRNELRILHILMQNPGCVITRQEMMQTLWDSDEFIDDNTLTVNINRLRKKLETMGVPKDFLITRRGQGYLV